MRLIQRLSQEEGINLNGIRRIVGLEKELDDMRQRVSEITDLMRQMTDMQQQVQRIFTAGPTGVQPGRHRREYLRALESGPTDL